MKFFINILALCIFFKTSSCIIQEEILDWWNRISIPKPYKCKLGDDYLKPMNVPFAMNFHPDPYIASKPCNFGDTHYQNHTFNGKTQNNQLIGLGKLRLFGDVQSFQLGELKDDK